MQLQRGKFSYSFLLYASGQPDKNGVYKVVTWWPYTEPGDPLDDEVAWGTLRFSGNTAYLQLPKSAHGGCWNVESELNDGEETGYLFYEEKPECRDVRVVKTEKAILHKQPDKNDHARAYLNKR